MHTNLFLRFRNSHARTHSLATTPTLTHSAYHNRIKDLEAQLNERPDSVYVRTKRDNTPLHMAVRGMSHQSVELLLERGAPVDALGRDGRTALHEACRMGDLQSVSMLLASGSDATIVEGTHNRLPSHEAALSGSTAILEELVAHGFESTLFQEDGDGRLPWHLAASCCNVGVMSKLSQLGQSVDQQSGDAMQRTALMETILANDGERSVVAARALLDRFHAGVNVVDGAGDTALHHALRLGNADMASLLLERGADPHARNHNGESALFLAVNAGLLPLAKELVQKYGCDLNEQAGEEQYSALHMAASRNDIPMVEFLLDAGADVNLRDKDNRTPLHVGTRDGATDVCLYLIDRGVSEKVIPYLLFLSGGEFYLVGTLVLELDMAHICRRIFSFPRSTTGRYFIWPQSLGMTFLCRTSFLK